MKKEIKKFITKKGGLYPILITIGLCVLALFLIAIGCVYGSLGGDWYKLIEWFGSDFAISLYVIFGLMIFAIIIINILIREREDIK